MKPNNTINSDAQKRRFAMLLHAGYSVRSEHQHNMSGFFNKHNSALVS